MAALGYEIGQVRIAKGTGITTLPDGTIGVVTQCHAGGFRINTLNSKNQVSPESDYSYLPADHEKWVDTGYGVEKNKDWNPSYRGVLVPAHKRKIKPGPIRETYLTGDGE